MRIKNRYNRNRAFRVKHWKRIRNQSHPFETFMASAYYNSKWSYTTESQIKDHFEGITRKARVLENGTHKQWVVWRASADYRRMLNKENKARERNAMNKIRNENFDIEMPQFKKDATWHYF